MIAYLEGKLVEKDVSQAILDVHGVGYQVRISLQTYWQINQLQGPIKLHTHLHITEDSHTLYGFFTIEEKSIFLQLISVNGIGPGTALMVLSSISPAELYQAITKEDVRQLQSIKGIGGKTAQRMILELKDKLKKTAAPEPADLRLDNTLKNNKNREEALAALLVLGLPKTAAEKTLDQILKSEGSDISTENLIKTALKSGF
jgi:Holliday junction DNA helicase RuvA